GRQRRHLHLRVIRRIRRRTPPARAEAPSEVQSGISGIGSWFSFVGWFVAFPEELPYVVEVSGEITDLWLHTGVELGERAVGGHLVGIWFEPVARRPQPQLPVGRRPGESPSRRHRRPQRADVFQVADPFEGPTQDRGEDLAPHV